MSSGVRYGGKLGRSASHDLDCTRIPIVTCAPAHEKIKTSGASCVEAVGSSDWPANIDLVLHKDENARFIVVGARIGATCLSRAGVPLHWNSLDTVSSSVFEPVPDQIATKSLACAAFILESGQDGMMVGYELPVGIATHPAVLEWELTAGPGEGVSRLRKGTDRVGKVVTKGETVREALELGRRF